MKLALILLTFIPMSLLGISTAEASLDLDKIKPSIPVEPEDDSQIEESDNEATQTNDLPKAQEGPQTQDEGAQKSRVINCKETSAKEINPPDCRGTNGHDIILGSLSPDNIFGYYGDDWINGSSGSDYISSGDGHNVIYGHSGNDRILGEGTIWGGDGADTINGGPSGDKISGGDGPDKIRNLAGSDMLYGNDGSDTIEGGYHSDTIEGGDGNDIIYGDDGADMIYGGPGDDKIYNFRTSGSGVAIDAYRDFIDCGSGNDEIWISNADRHANCEKVNVAK